MGSRILACAAIVLLASVMPQAQRPGERGPERLLCGTATRDIREGTFRLDIGTVSLRDGRGKTDGSEWDLTLKRADYVNGRFFLIILNANHVRGSGAHDSVFIYECRSNRMSQVFATRNEGGARVEFHGSSFTIRSGEWANSDPQCCPSHERTDAYAWNPRSHRFLRRSTRISMGSEK